MISRRNVLVGSVAAGAVVALRRAGSVLAAAPQTPVNFAVPAGACDCHTHVIGDPQRFPFWSSRVYTPEPAPAEESRAVHRALHVDRIVIVKALIEANPQRILWGSDWPHPAGSALPGHSGTDIVPNLQIDNGRLLNLVPVWAPDAALRKTILVDNPAQLFGF